MKERINISRFDTQHLTRLRWRQDTFAKGVSNKIQKRGSKPMPLCNIVAGTAFSVLGRPLSSFDLKPIPPKAATQVAPHAFVDDSGAKQLVSNHRPADSASASELRNSFHRLFEICLANMR